MHIGVLAQCPAAPCLREGVPIGLVIQRSADHLPQFVAVVIDQHLVAGHKEGADVGTEIGQLEGANPGQLE